MVTIAPVNVFNGALFVPFTLAPYEAVTSCCQDSPMLSVGALWADQPVGLVVGGIQSNRIGRVLSLYVDTAHAGAASAPRFSAPSSARCRRAVAHTAKCDMSSVRRALARSNERCNAAAGRSPAIVSTSLRSTDGSVDALVSQRGSAARLRHCALAQPVVR